MTEAPNGKQKNVLDDNGIIYVGGAIEDAKAEEICKKIIEYNTRSLDCIQLVINSPGGAVHSGFAVLDVMEWSRLPVYTTGLGMIASMALLIFMAGAKGHRVITPRVSILSHRFSWWSFGNHSELIARRKEEDLTHRRILDHYRTHTKLKTDDEVQAILLRDVDSWLTAEEAVAHGIADVIETRGGAG